MSVHALHQWWNWCCAAATYPILNVLCVVDVSEGVLEVLEVLVKLLAISLECVNDDANTDTH